MFTAALFTIARIWKQPKCHQQMKDKEDVVHILNGILLGLKKEQNWVICRDVDEPRVSYAVKYEREIQLLYINAYMWNLKKQYR